MRRSVLWVSVLLAPVPGWAVSAPLQVKAEQVEAKQAASMQAEPAQSKVTETPSPEQQRTSRAFAGKARRVFPPKPPKSGSLTPLGERDRAVQLLNRFAYGARPGDVDAVLAMGTEAWLQQQLQPAQIKDDGLERRLAELPSVKMSAAEATVAFPDRGQVLAVKEGRVPYPAEPLLNALYEVQVAKEEAKQEKKNADGSVVPRPQLSDAEKSEQQQRDRAEARQLAGPLIVLPKNERLHALVQMPIEERIVLTANGNLSNDQRTLLMNGFSPREREIFQEMGRDGNTASLLREELSQARVLRDVLSNRQLEEVMTNFWFNHFNVYMPKDSDQWYTSSYEREVIRPHALGKFSDLLLATAESPAMMVYLDNWLSIGPDSQANGVDPKKPGARKGTRGLNENYGREVMELHTLSVNGGYTQGDVTALSAILTGWTVQRVGQGGGFTFDPKRHEPGPKFWLGYRIEENGTVSRLNGAMPAVTFGPEVPGYAEQPATPESMKQGVAALKILAESPRTAHFISWLMAQYFVADDPPASVVARLEKTYLSTGGDVRAMLLTLAHSPEFNAHQYFHNKVKTPEEFLASAFRSTATEPQNPAQMSNTLRDLGEPLYTKLEPTGYYLTAAQWMSSNALVDRLNFAYALTTGHYPGQRFDAPRLLAMGLMTRSSTVPLQGMRASSGAGDRAEAKQVAWGPLSGETGARRDLPSAGAQVTLRVLEGTMIGTPVSGQTNGLIANQLAQAKDGDAVNTLNLLTALVMGAPEFQLR